MFLNTLYLKKESKRQIVFILFLESSKINQLKKNLLTNIKPPLIFKLIQKMFISRVNSMDRNLKWPVDMILLLQELKKITINDQKISFNLINSKWKNKTTKIHIYLTLKIHLTFTLFMKNPYRIKINKQDLRLGFADILLMNNFTLKKDIHRYQCLLI